MFVLVGEIVDGIVVLVDDYVMCVDVGCCIDGMEIFVCVFFLLSVCELLVVLVGSCLDGVLCFLCEVIWFFFDCFWVEMNFVCIYDLFGGSDVRLVGYE